jgi:hypothetical protein
MKTYKTFLKEAIGELVTGMMSPGHRRYLDHYLKRFSEITHGGMGIETIDQEFRKYGYRVDASMLDVNEVGGVAELPITTADGSMLPTVRLAISWEKIGTPHPVQNHRNSMVRPYRVRAAIIDVAIEDESEVEPIEMETEAEVESGMVEEGVILERVDPKKVERLSLDKGGNGGKFKVNMDVVKRRDNSAPYLRLLGREVRDGGGFVSVDEVDLRKGTAVVYAHDSMSYLLGGVTVPIEALSEGVIREKFQDNATAIQDLASKVAMRAPFVKEALKALNIHPAALLALIGTRELPARDIADMLIGYDNKSSAAKTLRAKVMKAIQTSKAAKMWSEGVIAEETDTEYQAFFRKALKKYGVESPDEFKTDAERKDFFDYVDRNWKAKDEGRKTFKEMFSAKKSDMAEGKAKR